VIYTPEQRLICHYGLRFGDVVQHLPVLPDDNLPGFVRRPLVIHIYAHPLVGGEFHCRLAVKHSLCCIIRAEN